MTPSGYLGVIMNAPYFVSAAVFLVPLLKVDLSPGVGGPYYWRFEWLES